MAAGLLSFIFLSIIFFILTFDWNKRECAEYEKKSAELDRKVSEFAESAEKYLNSFRPCIVVFDASSLMLWATSDDTGRYWYAKTRGFFFPDYKKKKRAYWDFEERFRKSRAIWGIYDGVFHPSGDLEVIVPECVLRKLSALCNDENEEDAKVAQMTRDFLEKVQQYHSVKIPLDVVKSKQSYNEVLTEYIVKLSHGDKKIIFICDDKDLRLMVRERIEEEKLDTEIKSVDSIERNVDYLYKDKIDCL